MHRKTWIISLLCLFLMGNVAIAAEKGMASKDKDFIKKAASAGMMEVQLGTLAQQKAASKDVKDFGLKMETEHGKANDELKAIAEQKKVDMPKEMERKHKSMVKKLGDVSKTEFDKEYMKMMVKDHKKDIEKFRAASNKVKDPELKAWVGKTLPVLEEHLKMAKETAAKIGVDVKKLEK